jgi:energy-coupling factor transporter ATP-binding protein EcfA2
MISDEEKTNNAIIRVSNLSFGYNKHKLIFNDVSFSIQHKDVVGIIGDSGSGKSTLGMILKGLIPHYIKGYFTGDVFIDSFDTKKEKISQLAKTIGMVFQDPNSQLFSNTVRKEIEFSLHNLGLALNLADKALESLNITDLAEENPLNLSAGQKQRVILASIIAPKPKILILDEPTAHLDHKSRKMLIEWLKKLNEQENITLLIIEQDPVILGELAHNILRINNGTVSIHPKTQYLKKDNQWCWINVG